jgi:hypothetical protein
MRRTELLQEVRIMRFDEAFEDWQGAVDAGGSGGGLLGI